MRPQTASKFGLKVLTGANGDETVVGYDTAAGRVYIDRTKSGTAAAPLTSLGFYGVHSAPLALRDGKLDLRILVDNSIVEVFANNGERVLTDLVYPAGSNGLKVFAEGGTAKIEGSPSTPCVPSGTPARRPASTDPSSAPGRPLDALGSSLHTCCLGALPARRASWPSASALPIA